MEGIPTVERRKLFAHAGAVDDVFPIAFRVRPELAHVCSLSGGTIRGFYRVATALGDEVVIETGTERSMHSEAIESAADPKCEVLDLARNGAAADALRRCRELIAGAPHDVGFRRLLVMVCELAEDRAGALRAIEEVLVLTPEDDSLHAWACRLCVGSGDFAACLSHSDRGLRRDGTYSEILGLYGARALYEIGRPAEAITRLGKVFPGTFVAGGNDPLLTRKGLLNACRRALQGGRDLE